MGKKRFSPIYMNNYKDKYLKYKKKYLFLKSINDVKTILNKKGHIYWYSEKGKLLTKSNDSDTALNDLENLIKETPKKFNNKFLIKVYVSYINKSDFPIELTVEIIKVSLIKMDDKYKLALNIRNNDDSLIRFGLTPDQVNYKDFKKIGKIVLDGKLKDFTKTYEKYTYEDIENLLEKK
jgi:hypothetical protein